MNRVYLNDPIRQLNPPAGVSEAALAKAELAQQRQSLLEGALAPTAEESALLHAYFAGETDLSPLLTPEHVHKGVQWCLKKQLPQILIDLSSQCPQGTKFAINLHDLLDPEQALFLLESPVLSTWACHLNLDYSKVPVHWHDRLDGALRNYFAGQRQKDLKGVAPPMAEESALLHAYFAGEVDLKPWLTPQHTHAAVQWCLQHRQADVLVLLSKCCPQDTKLTVNLHQLDLNEGKYLLESPELSDLPCHLFLDYSQVPTIWHEAVGSALRKYLAFEKSGAAGLSVTFDSQVSMLEVHALAAAVQGSRSLEVLSLQGCTNDLPVGDVFTAIGHSHVRDLRLEGSLCEADIDALTELARSRQLLDLSLKAPPAPLAGVIRRMADIEPVVLLRNLAFDLKEPGPPSEVFDLGEQAELVSAAIMLIGSNATIEHLTLPGEVLVLSLAQSFDKSQTFRDEVKQSLNFRRVTFSALCMGSHNNRTLFRLTNEVTKAARAIEATGLGNAAAALHDGAGFLFGAASMFVMMLTDPVVIQSESGAWLQHRRLLPTDSYLLQLICTRFLYDSPLTLKDVVALAMVSRRIYAEARRYGAVQALNWAAQRMAAGDLPAEDIVEVVRASGVSQSFGWEALAAMPMPKRDLLHDLVEQLPEDGAADNPGTTTQQEQQPVPSQVVQAGSDNSSQPDLDIPRLAADLWSKLSRSMAEQQPMMTRHKEVDPERVARWEAQMARLQERRRILQGLSAEPGAEEAPEPQPIHISALPHRDPETMASDYVRPDEYEQFVDVKFNG